MSRGSVFPSLPLLRFFSGERKRERERERREKTGAGAEFCSFFSSARLTLIYFFFLFVSEMFFFSLDVRDGSG